MAEQAKRSTQVRLTIDDPTKPPGFANYIHLANVNDALTFSFGYIEFMELSENADKGEVTPCRLHTRVGTTPGATAEWLNRVIPWLKAAPKELRDNISRTELRALLEALEAEKS
mgnify:CR=1 FL=1